MGKIVLEIEEFAKMHSEYRSFDQDRIRIGRGFDNDVIINDPYVAASHLTLSFIDGGLVCESLQTLNGSFITNPQAPRKKVKVLEACHIASGDTIFIGKTIIHVWGFDQPVVPEQVLDASSVVLFDPAKTVLSILFNLAIFCFIIYLYLSQWFWRKDYSFLEVVTSIGIILVSLVIWSGLWALITRFAKRRHRLLDHLVFSLQWTVLSIALAFVIRYILFFICNEGVDYVVSLAVFGSFSIFILRRHLTIATNLSLVKRTVIASLIVGSLIFLGVIGRFAERNEFRPDPQHYIKIMPVPKSLVPAISIGQEIKRLDSIF